MSILSPIYALILGLHGLALGWIAGPIFFTDTVGFFLGVGMGLVGGVFGWWLGLDP